MLVSKNIFKFIDSKNVSFSYYVRRLSKIGKVSSVFLYNNYLSISDPKRLRITRRYFNNKNKYILIDRDGVINKKNPNFFYVRNLNELNFNWSLIEKLNKISNNINVKYICITNQAGISTKQVTKNNLRLINDKIKNTLSKYGINIVEFFISAHHFNSNNFQRKPNPGLFLEASNKYNFILDQTFYIGDDVRDIIASYNSNTFCYFYNTNGSTKLYKKYNNILTGSLERNIQKFFND